jgi:hypothetical protein
MPSDAMTDWNKEKPMSKELKAGQLLVISEGCYSDYGITGFFVCLTTFAPMALHAEYMLAHPEQATEYRFRSESFLQFLLGKGLLLEINYATLHLGDYSSAGEVTFQALAKDQL